MALGPVDIMSGSNERTREAIIAVPCAANFCYMATIATRFAQADSLFELVNLLMHSDSYARLRA
jgi:hypothetical protein